MYSSDEEQNINSENQTSDSSKAPLIINSNRNLDNNLVTVKDRFNVVYLIFYLLGIGCLLPWNFFSNAKRYFSYKLRNCTQNESVIPFDHPDALTEDQILFINYLELASLLPGILFTVVSIIITNMVSANKRVIYSTVMLFTLFLVTAILTHVETDTWQKGFLSVSLLTASLMNAAVAILQGGLFGLAGKFPDRYMQSLMSGMGLGGFFAALSSLIITSLDTHPINSGLCYFSIATAALLACLIGFLVLPKITYANYYLVQLRFNRASINQDYVDIVVNSLTASRTKCSNFQEILDVFKKIWIYAVTLCLTFTITLTCYPAMLSAIQSTSDNKTWAEVYFSPVGCFLVFNLFDVVGRASSFIRWPTSNNPLLLLVMSILRLAFIPAFLFCNIQPRHYITTFLKEDWIPIVLNVFLGWSNGHLSTLCMMYAPRVVQNNQVELVGSIMPFFLSLGLGLGSLLSLLFMWKFV